VNLRLLLILLLCLGAAPSFAADLTAVAAGAKASEGCIDPLAKGDLKGFEGCLQKLAAAAPGAAEAKSTYTVGLYFQGWTLANSLAAGVDNDLFPDIKKRSAAKPERQLAMRLFDKFRPPQKKLKIKDDDLAKTAGLDPAALKPFFEYYDKLPKK
jgi:hypothetical protein